MSATEPQYFNLLWDYELESLRGLLRALKERRDEVLDNWCRLYVLHFGERRTLAEPEFKTLLGAELDAIIDDLLAGDFDAFARHVREAGERLSERGVPFSELIVSLHLFEESALVAFSALQPLPPQSYRTFDKLSHCRIIVLADAFFRLRSAEAGTRIRELEREAAQLPATQRTRFHGLVGASPAMRQLYGRIEAAARTRGVVLVVGESGTGKELVARAIHECGANPDAPFVALNCSALPKDLIESELFGYKRGAFSGASADHLGLFQAAHGGTLFLDEISEMSVDTQSKLLRAIQEHAVRPVGSTRETPVDARLIASTNRDPEEAIRAGQLREDLYYRLQANVINAPPLREHIEDIPLLIEHFIAYFNEKLAPPIAVAGIERTALEALCRYRWPGNVRELMNVIEGAFTFGKGELIHLDDLPPATRKTGASVTPAEPPLSTEISEPSRGMRSFADVERDLIKRALEISEGNRSQAARLLKISRKKLYAKIHKYGLIPAEAEQK